MRADFVELWWRPVAVERVSSLFALFDRPKEQVARVPGTIVADFSLEALIDARPTRGANSRIRRRARQRRRVERARRRARLVLGLGLVGGRQSPAGSLIAALEATARGSSHFSSVLLHTEAELRARAAGSRTRRGVAGGFVPVAATVLRLLNATARFGPETTQRALAPRICAWRRTTCYRSCWRCARASGNRGGGEGSRRALPRRAGSANARAEGSANAAPRRRTRRSVGSDGPVHRCVRASVSRQSGHAVLGTPPRAAPRICPGITAPREDRDAVPHARRGGVSTRDQSRTHRRGTESRDDARVYRQGTRGEGTRGGASAASAAGPPQFEFARVPPAMWADAEAYFDPKVWDPTR